MIRTENLTHIYMKDTPFQTEAIRDISIAIQPREIVTLAGPTGCGKSTLVQHFNALLRPTEGKVIVDGTDIGAKDVNLRELRQKVGLVFQYPEHQLFEETVYDDVAFGPRNSGFSKEEVDQSVRETMDFMELPFAMFRERSPFFLSGGEMRRVALAGVLAMKPKILILDEPTAGLDPKSRKRLLEKMVELRTVSGVTIILISHDVEEIASVSDRIIVMKEGRISFHGKTREVFSRPDDLKAAGILPPQYTELLHGLKSLDCDVIADIFTFEETLAEVLRFVGKGKV